ncbi:hypothetical protein AALO_G00267570 [Alosa alosa]|uniref:Uncharacterized protein n=1 Tax=Alosa alosa TaxID=278164 RepID=A0AAV6FRE8_9TELE|nr:uncharacterized protein LOC125286644 [Alosa alosa]KAG5263692.1 hypothetical protein AALO_G00267570 [Alosa alosa]
MLAEGFLRVLCYKDSTESGPDAHGFSSTQSIHFEWPGGHQRHKQAQRAVALKEEVEQVDFELGTVQSMGGGAVSIPKPTIFRSSPEPYPRCTPQGPLQPTSLYTQFCSSLPQRGQQQTNNDFREQDDYRPGEDAPALPLIDPIRRRLEAVAPDHGYLAMDSSITLQGGEPLTNSMLNGYLESKLTEVYSQYLQERLVRPGTSPRWSLLAPLPPGYVVQQLSHQVALEQGLEVDEARSLVLSYMHTQGGDSRAVSSHFSSPVLRISELEK